MAVLGAPLGEAGLTRFVFASDGRRLTVEEVGDQRGAPVFLLHGTPGSRLGPCPRPMVLYQLGIRLIAYDRPGYGGSDRLPGRTVADAAEDVAAIADALDLDRFAVLGRSGGGPHALACAALLPDRTTRAAVLVGLAPRHADGLDWFDGMTLSNIKAYTAAQEGGQAVADRLLPTAERVRTDPAWVFAGMRDGLTDSDRRVFDDFGIRRMLIENFTEGLRDSADGWIDDVLALSGPWGFDPGDITVPTLLWHGKNDMFSPVGHSVWLGARIRTARVIVQRGASHFGAIDVMPKVLPWLAAG